MSAASTEWGAPLTPWMIEAVQSLGFNRMTPVQASAIPLLSSNKDVVVEAVTGSGKTLAFILPILIRLGKLDPLRMGQTNVIVVSPTRELAHQTFGVLRSIIDLAPNPKFYKTQLVTGGSTSTVVADIKNFLSIRPHVVVATPGRLLELLKAQHVKTNALDLLVLDEADRLLDLGVDQTINKILSLMPKQKRVGLFSATMEADIIKDIIRVGMRNPVKVSVRELGASTLPDKLSIESIICDNAQDKFARSLSLLKTMSYRKAIVYIPTCTAVTYWYQVFKLFLPSEDFEVHSLHGKLQQAPRLKTLQKFRDTDDKTVLLTTDVAARGLDIPEVDLVIQMDPPVDPNMFVHRAGRTGRAGNRGLCVVMLCQGLEEAYVDFMSVRKVPITAMEPPSEPISRYLPTLREWVIDDRARHDLAVRSFLSFIRYYSKHTATSIFRTNALDLSEVAAAFGVVRLPRMPELKEKEVPNSGWLIEPFDMEKWSYADPQQERARLEKLTQIRPKESDDAREARLKAKQRNSVAWSAKLERKSTAQERRDKRQRRAIAVKENNKTSQDSDSDAEEDWKDLVQQRKRSKLQPSAMSFEFNA